MDIKQLISDLEKLMGKTTFVFCVDLKKIVQLKEGSTTGFPWGK